MFCFFPANWMSSTYTDKNNPFDGVRISIHNWKLSPNRIAIGFSQIASPITVLPKDDPTDCAQEERLGLPYWTMILAICVVVDESKCLDIPIWEFSKILEHLPFLLGYTQILHQQLVLRTLAVSRIIFHNITSEYNSTFVFLVLCLQFGILQMADVHQ